MTSTRGATALRDAAEHRCSTTRAASCRASPSAAAARSAFDVRVLARPPGPDGGVLVAHLHVDCRDAMGANLVNTLCEALAERVARIAGGRPGLRILSNLTDGRTITVRCRDRGERPAEVRAAVASASRFAELDPYRAATHNKGIMNGVDAVLVATGQDWRAVEAGAHAYAAAHRHLPPARHVARRRHRARRRARHAARGRHRRRRAALASGRAARARARRTSTTPTSSPPSPAPPASRRTSPRCAPSPPKASSAATWRCTRAASPAPPVPPVTSSIASPRSCPRAATSSPTAPAKCSRG